MPPRAITQVCPQCEMPLVLPVSFIGKTIACSRCGHTVLVSGPAEASAPSPEAAVPDVRPPHLREAAAGAAPIAVDVDDTVDQPSHQPQRRSCLYSGCMTIIVAALVLTAIVGMAVGAVYLATWDRRSMVTLDGMEQSDGKFDKRKYTDASRKAITRDGVTVRIDAVQLGKVDFRSKGEVLQTATPHYLIVNVTVKNKTRSEPVLYQSWYDHQFEDDEGNRQDIELHDDNARHWEVFTVPEADKVERHHKSEVSLSTDDETIDSLVFKMPDEYIDEPIPPLYLQLPGAAVGDSGVFRFHLPQIMVQRRDR